MSRRWLYAGLVLVVVLALSTVGATRAWSESGAHGRYLSAQKSAHASFAAARNEGLTGSELAGISRTLRRLDSARAPQTLPVISSDRGDFYNLQAKRYQAAQRTLRGVVRHVTAVTRGETAAALGRLGDDIRQGQRLHLDVKAAQLAQVKAKTAAAGARTPGQFRAISATIRAADSTLASTVRTRQGAVDAVLAETHHSLPALNTTARSEVSVVEPGLCLLALVNRRGTSDLSDLHARLAALSRDTQPDDAAVLMLDLRDRIAQSKKDVSTLLPAKMIVVSTESQNATMYEGGSQVYSAPVTTGGPELPTDHGVFHIYMKASNFTFHSPWPEGSPYYYPPTFVQYWMPFYGGEGLHDASWRTNFGPGSNLSPTDLGTGNYILGTHGCVNLPTAVAGFVWNWAPIGTTVVVI